MVRTKILSRTEINKTFMAEVTNTIRAGKLAWFRKHLLEIKFKNRLSIAIGMARVFQKRKKQKIPTYSLKVLMVIKDLIIEDLFQIWPKKPRSTKAKKLNRTSSLPIKFSIAIELSGTTLRTFHRT